MRTLLTWTPRILAAATLAGLALLGASPLVRDHLPKTKPLDGMQLPPVRPPLTVKTLWSSDYQKATEANAAAALPLRPVIVRAYNQIQWNTFGTSYMASGSIIRGRKGALFEESYILAHCGLAGSADPAALPAFAARLRKAQDWFQGRGQTFVYVLAPVKTTWFADLIPASYPCAGPKKDALYPAARSALNAAGVHWVDGRAVLEAQRGKLGYELFPRNGIHWNQLGVALTGDALVDVLRRQDPSLPKPTWTVSTVPDEIGPDRDLASLLNLRRQPAAWKTPAVTPQPLAPPGQGRLTLTAVNDSFMDQLTLFLNQSELVSKGRNYGYVTLAPIEYKNGGAALISPDGLPQDLLTSNVVVLETVETQTGGELGQRFLKIVEDAMAQAPATKAKAS
jgi:hypothetical protein